MVHLVLIVLLVSWVLVVLFVALSHDSSGSFGSSYNVMATLVALVLMVLLVHYSHGKFGSHSISAWFSDYHCSFRDLDSFGFRISRRSSDFHGLIDYFGSSLLIHKGFHWFMVPLVFTVLVDLLAPLVLMVPRNDIIHKQTEKPVAGHFNRPGHSLDDLRIAVLEVMRSFDESLRRRRESYWIKHHCNPEGMNRDAYQANMIPSRHRVLRPFVTTWTLSIAWISAACS